jgi:predicted secreted protein
MKGGYSMGKIDWDVVTNYTDVVTTTLKTVTFPKVQEQVYLRNQGNANFTYTIGSQSGTLTPGQSVTVNQDVSSFTVQAVSGTHTFELRAKEKGTEQIEDNSTDVMSLVLSKSNQNYVEKIKQTI